MPDSVERIEIDLIGRDRGMGRTLDDTARGADRAGTSLDHLGRQSGQLKAKISETEIKLKELIKEFDRTQDITLFRDIRKDRSTLALLVALDKQLNELEHGAKKAGDGLFEVLGALPSRLKGAAIVGAIAAAPLFLPSIGAAVGGAVLGGVGLGGIIGGVFAAAQDERVAAAGADLGANFMGGFKEAGRVLISPILDQMQTLNRAEDIFLADLTSGFAALAPVIKPVADGLAGFVENLNLDEAFTDALPAIRAIAHELPEVASAISDMLESIGDESDGAVMGLIELFHIIEGGLRFVGDFIAAMSAVFEWEVKAGYGATFWAERWLDGVSKVTQFLGPLGIAVDQYKEMVGGLNDEDASLIAGLHQAKDAGDDWRGSLSEQEIGARAAADAAKEYEDAIDNLFNQILGLKDAQLRYNLDLIKTREELHEGAKTLSINTEEGLKNQQAILGMVRDIKQLRDQHVANGMEVERANGLYEQQMNQLIKLAVQYGFNRQEVRNFIGALADVPQKVAGEVVVHGLDPALNHAIKLNQQIDELDGKRAHAYVLTEFASYRAGERNPSGAHAAGGPELGGRAYLVGENGPELRTEMGNGYVHSAAQTRMLLSGLSGGSAGPAAPPPVVINFTLPTFTGDPIADALLRQFREGVEVEAAGNVVVYWNGRET